MATFNREEYLTAMGLGDDAQKQENALNRAHEIRMFEIRMLWQRALFFWGFQVAVLFALGSVFEANSSRTNKEFIYPFLISIGLITTIAQVLVYKGSKFWQETWEFHIDMLEEEFEGKVHQLHLKEKKDNGAKPISVSKVGEYTSIIFLFCWVLLWVVSMAALLTELGRGDLVKACACGNWLQGAWGIFLMIGTGLSAWVLCKKTRGSSEEPKTIVSEEREITYE